ncbi:branched-chain amino acid ABC transporter permease [Variovorax sp. RKNM96]|uniref:branched-chain amino acid ABC transporter permease n=1 Tax=Variovorax sp. RKNM96 TaxID=2681552 RepID=UPI001F126F4D|nr:branched-chain amino acid ABC transporter permease [Variovorax sp. RKNM96]
MAEPNIPTLNVLPAPRRARAAGMQGKRWVFVAVMFVVLGAVPLAASLAGESFYVSLVSRMMIYALAALGLNLVVGYGGLVSFGHAMYLGIGAYAVGILSYHGVGNGYVHVAAALAAGALVATLVGLVCLRVSGVAFIMITLAFAQMLYFLAVSLKTYGGDDGYALPARSDFGFIDIGNATVLYYLVFAVLMLALFAVSRVVDSRFGMALRGCKSNERRMRALGFPAQRFKLIAYVASALVCVLAGVLLANLTSFVSPSYMQWSVSGELLIMVVFGGVGTLLGPVVGAVAWLVLEELLSSAAIGLPWGGDEFLREHWLGLLGIVVVLVAINLKDGLYGSLAGRKEREGT